MCGWKYPDKNFIFNIYFITDQIDTNKLKYQIEEVNVIKWLTKDELVELCNTNCVLEPHKFIIKKFICNDNI